MSDLSAPLRVLVVEDNLVNQQVAAGLLKRYGIEPVLALDGLTALERLRSEAFDLVLMDIQMPVLDGLAATRAIRCGEGGAAHLGVPVVAMTANATPSDREASFAAGMNDYVTKPVSAEKMCALIEKWAPRAMLTFNRTEMQTRLQLDDDVVRQIVRLFWEDLPVRRAELIAAVAHRDIEEILRLAHNLKGTAANLVAQGVVDAAEGLETSAAADDWDAIERTHGTVLGEIDLLCTALAEFLR